ncbi:hypothetical protein [Streptomyces sp. SLBN-8D4]|uniref:hypothetical protein n=1 Tax=Streptomyces sp. SLBN-8D4 TaxID=3377728 RepID=UPI003C7B3924
MRPGDGCPDAWHQPQQDTTHSDNRLALDLALTVRHGGHGGVADDLSDLARPTAWVRGHAEPLPGASELVVDKTTTRAAVVTCGPPSASCSPAPCAPARPAPPTRPAACRCPRPSPPRTDLTAVLAQAAIAFLSGADRRRPRACPAPRCVRSFHKQGDRP